MTTHPRYLLSRTSSNEEEKKSALSYSKKLHDACEALEYAALSKQKYIYTMYLNSEELPNQYLKWAAQWIVTPSNILCANSLDFKDRLFNTLQQKSRTGLFFEASILKDRELMQEIVEVISHRAFSDIKHMNSLSLVTGQSDTIYKDTESGSLNMLFDVINALSIQRLLLWSIGIATQDLMDLASLIEGCPSLKDCIINFRDELIELDLKSFADSISGVQRSFNLHLQLPQNLVKMNECDLQYFRGEIAKNRLITLNICCLPTEGKMNSVP